MRCNKLSVRAWCHMVSPPSVSCPVTCVLLVTIKMNRGFNCVVWCLSSVLVAEHLIAQHSAIKMLHSRVKIILEYVKAVEAGERMRGSFND